MSDKKNLAIPLEEWFEENKRLLPWRETTDPYLIWVSEIILQQTRVAQGLDYYNRFVARFPEVAALADADEDEVLKYWEGLGYYSRARNMHTAARQVMHDFGGCFPDTYEGIRSLKGVGDYTAAAIASFAYGLPHAVVDGMCIVFSPGFLPSIRPSIRRRAQVVCRLGRRVARPPAAGRVQSGCHGAGSIALPAPFAAMPRVPVVGVVRGCRIGTSRGLPRKAG